MEIAMIRKVGIALAAFGLVAGILLCLPGRTAWSGDQTMITDLLAQEVVVYGDESMATKLGKLKRGAVPMPIPVLKVAPNMMLHIKAGGFDGWVRSTMVKAEFGDKKSFDKVDLTSCNYAGSDETGGSIRGIGENCKK
jgi:hypothetical protein